MSRIRGSRRVGVWKAVYRINSNREE